MSRAKVVAGVSGVVALASLIGMAVVASQPPVYSGDPNAPVAQVSWGTLQTIFGMLFTGSTLATIQSVWAIIRPLVRSVTPPAIPLPSENIASQVEFIAAALAYYKSPADKASQLRFAMSSLTEIGNIEAMKSGDVPARLRDLTAAIVAQQFPVTE